jgi:hypothetical protein
VEAGKGANAGGQRFARDKLPAVVLGKPAFAAGQIAFFLKKKLAMAATFPI